MQRLLFGIVMTMPACAVGPDYVRPQVAVNANWSEYSDPRIKAAKEVDTAWWTTFSDPTLDSLIEASHHQNLTLQVAALRIFEARAQYGVAVGNQWPQRIGPSAKVTANRLTDQAAEAAGLDRTFLSYDVGFDAVWELDIWGKYRRGARAAHADYLATVADYEAALVSLTGEVARTYVLIRTYETLIALARDNAAIQEDALTIAEARFKNGATSELDVSQQTALLETTRAQIPELEIKLRQTQNALSTLLGRPPGQVEQLLEGPHGIPVPPKEIGVGVPAEVLRRRPDIRAAELRAMAQCDRIGVAKAELYPSFTLFGTIGTQGLSSGATRAGVSAPSLFGPGSFVYNAGGSLFWPILNYKRLQNNVRIEDARFQQSLTEYMQTVLSAAQEVEDGMIGMLREQDSAVFAQNAVNAAQNAVKVSLVQYREGAVDYQRVLDAQRILLDSQNRLANTQSAAATNTIALYKALGGGWQVRRAPLVPDATRREMQDRTRWGHGLDETPASPPAGK
ncbi:MAG TPA: efflux transporter outer membrane subunit [Kofleriaceae bacterium]|nr:efflux transporter outer membrane subunit [Kofleriaceae bacterium]